MNFIPVRREPPSRQPRESGWRLWLLLAWRWSAVGFLVVTTVFATARWGAEPEVPANAVPVVAAIAVVMVAAAAMQP